MTNKQIEEERTPDELMEGFRGSSLKMIILLTVVVHVVLLVGTSAPYLWKSVMGDTSKMSEDERIESAMREARAAIQEIAGEYDVDPQDIGKRFGGKASRAPKPKTEKAPKTEAGEEPGAEPGATTGTEPGTEAGEPKSAIETELDVKADGPALPGVEEDDDDDLFK